MGKSSLSIKIDEYLGRDLVPFVRFKKHEKQYGGVLLLVNLHTSACNFILKVTLLHGCFSRFLNYTNGTKLRKASHFKATRRLFSRNEFSRLHMGQSIQEWTK